MHQIKSYFIDPCIDFSNDSIDNESSENIINDFTNSIKGEKSSSKFDESKFPNNPTIPLQEDDIKTEDLLFHKKPEKKNLKKKIKEKKQLFETIYTKNDKNDSLFTKNENKSNFEEEAKNFCVKKRLAFKRPRKDNKDNILKKITIGFFNDALLTKLNDKLKSIKSVKYLVKFPQSFCRNVIKKRNHKVSNLSLGTLFEKEELCNKKNRVDLFNYNHNLKVVQSEEIKENKEFQKILNKTYFELYEEYINSYEFRIGEINKLKKKKMKEEYIQRYIIIARGFLKFSSL